MKKIFITFISVSILLSCNYSEKVSNQKTEQETTSEEGSEIIENTEVETAPFDINTIPVSTADIGDFPFFTLPKGLKSQNKPFQRNFDVCFFPINGVMTPFEGKLYKINVSGDNSEPFSKRYFEKSLEDYLSSIGAIKVFDGEITREEYERYQKEDSNKGADGDIGYADENIKFYAIRTQDKGNVYVQFSANNANGKLNILQEESLKQTIKKMTSEDIANDLLEKGKSVLHINFDTDKATLKPDGLETVIEITKVLKNNPELKIAINGYTDNSGSQEHNQKLSENRALSVKNEIEKAGISSGRLTSNGYGQESPIADNNTDEGKTQNRRVELIKLK